MLDEQPSPVGSLLSRVTQLSPRIRIVAAASVAIFVTSIVAATISLAGTPDESSVVAAVVEETSTPSPTPPPPTPTPPPPWPWPAERIERGELAADLFNPTSGGFPPPPPLEHTPIVDGPPVVRMVAPSLGINHYITTVSVVDGQMLSPEGDDANYAVGWYPSDDTWTFGNPGEAGNVVFSAHETWNKTQGPFYNLHRAHIGDDITLEMADGERRHYQVVRVTRYPIASIPMAQVLWPKDRPEAEEWLTLYTCGGQILYDSTGFGTYFDRDVLVAKWVGSDYPNPAPVTIEPLTLSRDEYEAP
ncbi:MAG: class F sortase [Chloroflexi bacterium]|nr:class F sortase [Chloroflexota bacterium]